MMSMSRPIIVKYLKRSFVYNGSVLWNSLRYEVKLADNVNAFKPLYKDMILFPSQLCS